MIFVSSASTKKDKIKDSILALQQIGINCIELSGGTQYYEGFQNDLQNLQNEYGLLYTSHGYFPPPPESLVINLASVNNEIYEKSIKFYLDTIRLLEQIKCKALSVHAGFYLDISSDEIGSKISLTKTANKIEADNRFCKAINELKNAAKSAGMNFFVENNVISAENYENFNKQNLLLMTDSKSIIDFQKIVDFELLLDIGHLKVSCNTLGIQFESELKKLLSLASWLHLHNNDGKRDTHSGFATNDDLMTLLKKYKHILPDDATLEIHGNEYEIKNSFMLISNLFKENTL